MNAWLIDRPNYNPKEDSLFISNRGIRLTTRAIQIVIKHGVEKAGLSEYITPHKLRHSGQYKPVGWNGKPKVARLINSEI